MNAFDQLLAEGYMEGRVGDGTYVSRVLPEEALYVGMAASAAAIPRHARQKELGSELPTPGSKLKAGTLNFEIPRLGFGLWTLDFGL